MAQFQAFDSNVEVNGETVTSVVLGMRNIDVSPKPSALATVFSVISCMGGYKTQALKILEEHGIVNPKPGKWYPQQAWLNAFKTIAENVGDEVLFEIGKKIPESARWPNTKISRFLDINSIEKALQSIDIAYHINHRGGEIGNYNFIKISNHSAKMYCYNPYPCNFDRGIILSVARKYKPEEITHVSVVHDDTQPCRKNGDDSCTYIVNW